MHSNTELNTIYVGAFLFDGFLFHVLQHFLFEISSIIIIFVVSLQNFQGKISGKTVLKQKEYKCVSSPSIE